MYEFGFKPVPLQFTNRIYFVTSVGPLDTQIYLVNFHMTSRCELTFIFSLKGKYRFDLIGSFLKTKSQCVNING